ncbi:MAG: hypothetical protein ACK5P1_11925 [Sphingobacteriia bacterium]
MKILLAGDLYVPEQASPIEPDDALAGLLAGADYRMANLEAPIAPRAARVAARIPAK